MLRVIRLISANPIFEKSVQIPLGKIRQAMYHEIIAAVIVKSGLVRVSTLGRYSED